MPVGLFAVAVAALATRLYALGHRVFYYDEAWFGYWTLRFLETGAWEYRPILHGPFFARVNSVIFPLFGPGDASARLVVALIGGLLPLAAWLFREHLRDVEVLALGVVLAANPILLYYGRFMRKDLPLAAFMLLTLGLLVRAADTGRARYGYAAAVTLGLAFTTKESVLLWLLAWFGAAVLLLDRRLLRARDRRQAGGAVATARTLGRRGWSGFRRWWPHLAIATSITVAVVVLFYAPRSPGMERPGLWKALTGEIGTLPAVIEAATVGSLREAVSYWAAGSIQRHPYLPYLGDTLRTLGTGALGVSVLAVLGFLHDRYTGDAPRDLVAFNFYVGAAAVVGYPLANNLPVPWSTVHAVVPLAVPAAVGAGVVVDWGRGRRRPAGLAADTDGGHPTWRRRLAVSRPSVRRALAVGLLAALALNAAAVGLQTSYVAPHESPRADPGNEVVYYAQAPGSLRAGVDAIAAAAAEGDGHLDVLYVGDRLAMNESRVDRPPATGAWHARMPLPWYTEALGADVASVPAVGAIEAPPPVVITTPARREAVGDCLGDGYEARTQPLDDLGDRTVVFFVRTGPTTIGSPSPGAQSSADSGSNASPQCGQATSS